MSAVVERDSRFVIVGTALVPCAKDRVFCVRDLASVHVVDETFALPNAFVLNFCFVLRV